eukprot:6174807-Pleurochrysis_carterae.AAC.2
MEEKRSTRHQKIHACRRYRVLPLFVAIPRHVDGYNLWASLALRNWHGDGARKKHLDETYCKSRLISLCACKCPDLQVP